MFFPMYMLVLSISVNTSVRIGIKVSVRLISHWNVHNESQKVEGESMIMMQDGASSPSLQGNCCLL